jgi:hypothetical protein
MCTYVILDRFISGGDPEGHCC